MKSLTATASLLLGLFLGSPAMAAQDAVITVEQAALRERPSLDAKIIESRAAGNKIRVSSYNKDGWYKTKATTGQFGWIWQADLTILDFKSDVRAANLELEEKLHERRNVRREPWLFFRFGGGLYGLVSSEMSNRLGLGAGHVYLSPGGFGELAVRLEERLRLALRLETFSNSTSTTHNTIAFTVNHSTTPLLLGLDADVSRGESFDISAGFYGGISLANEIGATATGLQTPNSFNISASTYAIQVNFSAKYYFYRWLQAVFELDILYTPVPAAKLTNSFNGDGQFRDPDGQLSSVRSNFVGPILAAGLQFAL